MEPDTPCPFKRSKLIPLKRLNQSVNKSHEAKLNTPKSTIENTDEEEELCRNTLVLPASDRRKRANKLHVKLMKKFNTCKDLTKADFDSSPSVSYRPLVLGGTFNHRNILADSNSDISEFDSEEECVSEMIHPMKRSINTDVNSGSPLLLEGDCKL